jgi:hypothetical protein
MLVRCGNDIFRTWITVQLILCLPTLLSYGPLSRQLASLEVLQLFLGYQMHCKIFIFLSKLPSFLRIFNENAMKAL